MNKDTSIVKQEDTTLKIDQAVLSVIEANKIQGFEKAFVVASAANTLREALTADYMKPIMALQGHKLGFKTDKDTAQGGGKGPGYPVEVVRDCLIEAVLTGVQPTGNHFNIIANNCYITKEGFGYLLKKIPGLSHELIFDLPRINADKTSAAVKVKIRWVLNGGQREEREMEFPIKMNQYMGTDAVIGKATRKARAWLFNTLMNTEISDGDADTLDTTHVDLSKEEKENLYQERIKRQQEQTEGKV